MHDAGRFLALTLFLAAGNGLVAHPGAGLVARVQHRDSLFDVGELDYASHQVVARAALGRLIAALPASDDEDGSAPLGWPEDAPPASVLRGATLGFGFEVFSVPPAALKNRLPIEQAMATTGSWRFTVLAAGKPVALMTLARISGQLRVVQLGSAHLAHGLTTLAALHLRQGAERLRFITVAETQTHIVRVSYPGNPQHFVLLTEPDRLLHSDELMERLAPAHS